MGIYSIPNNSPSILSAQCLILSTTRLLYVREVDEGEGEKGRGVGDGRNNTQMTFVLQNILRERVQTVQFLINFH